MRDVRVIEGDYAEMWDVLKETGSNENVILIRHSNRRVEELGNTWWNRFWGKSWEGKIL